MRHKFFDILLKFSAFIVPFYFVYFGPLHANQESQKIKTLWKYVFSGFSCLPDPRNYILIQKRTLMKKDK